MDGVRYDRPYKVGLRLTNLKTDTDGTSSRLQNNATNRKKMSE